MRSLNLSHKAFVLILVPLYLEVLFLTASNISLALLLSWGEHAEQERLRRDVQTFSIAPMLNGNDKIAERKESKENKPFMLTMKTKAGDLLEIRWSAVFDKEENFKMLTAIYQ